MLEDIVQTIYSCKFSKNNWDINEWTYVKRPDVKQDLNECWVQGENYIENNNPTHTSMIYKKKFKGNLIISSTISFLDRMAPSIVLASEFATNQNEKMEYRKNFAIVLFDRGINVWRHVYKNGDSYWTKVAFWNFRLVHCKIYNFVFFHKLM